MNPILQEDLQRIHELIYGEMMLKENNNLLDKLKKVATNLFGKKDETPITPTPHKPRIVPATNNSTPEMLKAPSPKIKSYISKPTTSNGSSFIKIDLSTHKGYNLYSEICQAFINKRNPNAGINGSMLASAAKNVYNSTKKYIPPELALAQLALEGGLSKDPKAKPIRTNNPFNVGHYDNGRSVPFRTKQEGINKYYQLIANSYLGDGKTAEHLIKNFTNLSGNRYASSPDYESKLKQIMKEVINISQSITSTRS